MAHKYNDIVTLVRGEVETPALVVQSSQQADGEHLQVVSLDPAKASPLLSGQNVDAAIRKDYVTPLENGKTFGWKERPALPTGGEPSEETGEQKDLRLEEGNVARLETTVSEQAAEIESLHSKIKEMEAILNQAPEPAPPQPNAAEQRDAAQGEVEPGDPESPHAIDAPTEAAPEATADPTSGSQENLSIGTENASESTDPQQ